MERAGDRDALLHAEPAGHELIGRQACADGELRSRRFANRAEELANEAQPTIGRAVIAVAAPVAEGREKLGREVAVRDRDLDSIQAAFARVASTDRVAGDQLADLGQREPPGL